MLVRNPHYKLLSVAIAVMAWLFVQGRTLTDGTVVAEVEYLRPEGLATVDELDTVNVLVEGSRSALLRAKRGQVKVLVDLRESSAGTQYVVFGTETGVDGLSGVTVMGYEPPSWTLELDQLGEFNVRVKPDWFAPPDGYSVARVTTEPSVVAISGPVTAIKRLNGVISTKPMNLEKVREDGQRKVELDVPPQIQVIGGNGVLARIDIEPTRDSKVFVVPVAVANRDWVAEVETVRVKLEGPSGDVRRIKDTDIVVLAYLPDNPTRTDYDVRYGPREGLRLQVIHPGGEEVQIRSIDPPSLEVKRR